MIDKALIYEVHFSNFNRYVIPLAKYLVDERIAKDVLLVYDSFTQSEKIMELDNDCINLLQVKRAYKILSEDNTNDIFINYSYRITDLYWTYKFKKIGVYTYQLQHGMYAEFLERSFLGYFSAVNRKAVYLRYLLSFFLKGNFSIFLYLFNKDFSKSFKINNYIEENKKDKITPLHSDHVFVWGEYWKEWFMKNHYYSDIDDFTTVGNPDYHTFIKGKNIAKQARSICYIAQTFVEDGRMEKQEYKAVVDKLSNAVKERLIVKLHPRSDKSIFDTVIANSGELTYDFPITGFYVGHYSSLLALAANEDSKVFLLEINGEKIPYYFKNSADGIFSTIENLVDAILENDTGASSKEISYYFENKEEHPFSLIGRKIAERS